ncbi:MAG: type IX secretion system protein PorQ [Muribaculaceae bacterium]|nr:type IX secretion system protein PorQ [Muribaculaceae bacterium]
MIFTKRLCSALLGVALACSVWAQDGTTAYQYLNVPVSSHVYGLGGHNISIIDDDINLVEQNPALLGPEFNHQVGLNYMKYIGETNFMGARYGQGITDHSAVAVGIQYYGYGDFVAADPDGTITGTFTASDINFNITYSHDINDNLRGGITLKYLHSAYEDYTAGAIAADLGINYYDPDHEFSASLVAKNLGGQVKQFNDKKDNLPWDIQVGITKKFASSPFRFSITGYNLRKWKQPYYEIEDKENPNSDIVKREKFGSNLLRHLVFGAEFIPANNIYFGIGYNYKTRTDMSSYKRNLISGLSACAGLRVKAFGLGLALAQPHSGATTIMVNLTTSIGELLK